MCFVISIVPNGSPRNYSDKPNNMFFSSVSATTNLLDLYYAFRLNHRTDLLHSFLVILFHSDIIIMSLVRTKESLRVVFFIVVESRKDRKLLEFALLIIKRECFNWCEINCDVDPFFAIYEHKLMRMLILIFMNLFCMHWRHFDL